MNARACAARDHAFEGLRRPGDAYLAPLDDFERSFVMSRIAAGSLDQRAFKRWRFASLT